MIKRITLKPTEAHKFSYTEQELYYDYKKELWSISGESGFPREKVNSWYMTNTKSETYFIRILDTLQTPEQIGFMLIGVNSNCHEDADYYIQDSYILLEYRRQHIMEDAFQSFIKSHPGKYCLIILNDNKPAISFWNKQFGMNLYKEVPIEDYHGMTDEFCTFHAFKKGDKDGDDTDCCNTRGTV